MSCFAPAISSIIVSGGLDMLRRRKNVTGTGRLERDASWDETNTQRVVQTKDQIEIKAMADWTHCADEKSAVTKDVFTVERSAFSALRCRRGAPKSEDEVQIPGVFLWPCRCCSARCAGLSSQISDRILLRPTVPPAFP